MEALEFVAVYFVYYFSLSRIYSDFRESLLTHEVISDSVVPLNFGRCFIDIVNKNLERKFFEDIHRIRHAFR